MIILTAIGRFFKKIWDWIRQTAWIQPLLIVGVIFGIIFSIPSIVKAVKNGRKEKSTYAAYYHQFKLSLEGEKDSAADKFTTELYEALNNEGKASEFVSSHNLGDKFFLAYVAKECPECENAKEGFSTFEKKFKDLTGDSGRDFHMVTIFIDDENEDTTDDKPAFWSYLERHLDFFAASTDMIWENGYSRNGHLPESELEHLESADGKEFNSPTIMLVELGDAAKSNPDKTPGISEIMFGVEGGDKNAKAHTLRDCWKHEGEFSKNDNN